MLQSILYPTFHNMPDPVQPHAMRSKEQEAEEQSDYRGGDECNVAGSGTGTWLLRGGRIKTARSVGACGS
jgi:hypothetical protein